MSKIDLRLSCSNNEHFTPKHLGLAFELTPNFPSNQIMVNECFLPYINPT